MNQDNRNLVLAIVCSALLVIGYQIFYELPKQQALEEQALLEQKDLILTAPEQTSNNEKIAETSIQQTEIVNAPRITIDTPSIEGSISLAGARIDDIVLKIQDVVIDDIYKYMEILSKIEPGTKVQATILRKNEELNIDVQFMTTVQPTSNIYRLKK